MDLLIRTFQYSKETVVSIFFRTTGSEYTLILVFGDFALISIRTGNVLPTPNGRSEPLNKVDLPK